MHGYADDTQLYSFFRPGHNELSVRSNLHECIDEVRCLMRGLQLKLNDQKTEFLILGTQAALKKVVTTSITVGNQVIPRSPFVKNIGAYFDPQLKMDVQIKNVCKDARFNLYRIGKIRKYLTTEQTKTLAHAYVTSKLDGLNSLLFGLPKSEIQKLQRVQNSTARLITGSKKFDHITPILKELHWLPVQFRIEFKVLLLSYKALYGGGPVYLRDLLKFHSPDGDRVLRSASDASSLQIPRSRLLTYGDRSFCVFAPKLWNGLPISVREAKTVSSFKSALKTLLFKAAFNA